MACTLLEVIFVIVVIVTFIVTDIVITIKFIVKVDLTLVITEGGKGGIVIPFHAQILTKFTLHVLNQSLSEKPQGNEIFTTKHK